MPFSTFPCPPPTKGMATFPHRGVIPDDFWGYVENLEYQRSLAFTNTKYLSLIAGTGIPTNQCWGRATFADANDKMWEIVFYRDGSNIKAVVTEDLDNGPWFPVLYCNGSGTYAVKTWSMAGVPECDSARGVIWITDGVSDVCSLDCLRYVATSPGPGYVAVIHNGTTNNSMLATATVQIPRGRWVFVFENRMTFSAPPGEPDTDYFSLETEHDQVGEGSRAKGMRWMFNSKDGDRIIGGLVQHGRLFHWKRAAIFQFGGEFEPDVMGEDGRPRPNAFWKGSLRSRQIEGVYGATHHRGIGYHPGTREILYRSKDGWRALNPPPPDIEEEKSTRWTEPRDVLFRDVMKGGGMYGLTVPDDPSVYKVPGFDVDSLAQWQEGTTADLEMSLEVDNGGVRGGLKLIGSSDAKKVFSSVVASQSNVNHPASYSWDENLTTLWRYWETIFGTQNYYLTGDLGSQQTVNKFKARNVAAAVMYSMVSIQITLECSLNGTDWYPIKTWNSGIEISLTLNEDYTLGTWAYRYWRIHFYIQNNCNQRNEVHVAEWELWGGNYSPAVGTYTSAIRKAGADALRWGLFKVSQLRNSQPVTYKFYVSTNGSTWETPFTLTVDADEKEVDLEAVMGATKPITTYPWFKWTVELQTNDNTITPYVYRVLTTWVEGEPEPMLQGVGAIEDRFFASLSYSSVFDQVLECDRSGAWYLRKYGSYSNPAQFFEFKGKGYATQGKNFSSSPEASLYRVDGGSAMQLIAVTKAYNLGSLIDKEVCGVWITYRQMFGTPEVPEKAFNIYYNMDDEFAVGSGGTGNLLADLLWHRLGGGSCTIATDGSKALTTQFVAFPMPAGDTKGKRVSLKFVSYGEVEIHAWDFLKKDQLSMIPWERGIDPRGELEKIEY